MTSDNDPSAELMCPWCQGPFGTTLSMEGSTVHCPHCDREVTVPSRDELLAMTAPPTEPPPVAIDAGNSSPPPVVAERATPASTPPVTTEASPPLVNEVLPTNTPSPVAAARPEVVPAKIVHAQSREGDAVAFRARGKVIHTAQGDVELRQRSRGERSFRRSLRNIVLIILCLAVLLGLPAWLLSQKSKLPPSPPPSENSTEPSTSAAP